MESLYVDSLGREHVEVGGNRFCVEVKPDFEEWLHAKYGQTMSAFMNLKRYEREKIFLLWKWGLCDTSNTELESSRRAIMHLIRDMDLQGASEDYKFYLQRMKMFEHKCYLIKQNIGLVDMDTKKDPRMEKIMEQFNARVA